MSSQEILNERIARQNRLFAKGQRFLIALQILQTIFTGITAYMLIRLQWP